MLLLQFALRLLSPKRTSSAFHFTALVAIGSVALGSIALILALSVLQGFEEALQHNAVRFSAHITVEKFGKRPIENHIAIEDTLQKISNIRSLAPYIMVEGLLSYKGNTDGMIIKGVLPERDVTGVFRTIKQGSTFTSANAYEVILGEQAAKKFNCTIGDVITLYALQGEGTSLRMPIVEQCTVVGIYSTGLGKFDETYCFVPYAQAAFFANVPQEYASGFDIMTNNIQHVTAVSDIIATMLGYPFFPRTIFETHGAMFAWIDLQKEPIPLVLGLLSLVAVFNIVTALLLLIVEKMRAIGILATLGLPPAKIMRVFLMQGILLSLVGAIPGCCIAWAICWVQSTFSLLRLDSSVYFLDAVPVAFNVWHYGIVIGGSVGLSILATFIPARIAASMPPLKALLFR